MTTTEKKPMFEEFVTFKVLSWIIGLFMLLFGWVITANAQLQNKVEATTSTQNDIKVQLGQIQTDIAWIKGNIKH